MTKIFTTADVPDDLAKAWLQHLRDFDDAHPGCHFEVMGDAPERSLKEIIDDRREIQCWIDHHHIFERRKK